jgi:hypothetical protein
MNVGGEAAQGLGWRDEAVAGAGGGGLELSGREHAQSAGVATGEMLLNPLLVSGWEFAVDERANLVGIEMFD